MEMENDGYFEPIAPYSTYSELHLGFSGWACSSREILIMQGMPVKKCTMIVCVSQLLVPSIDTRYSTATFYLSATLSQICSAY